LLEQTASYPEDKLMPNMFVRPYTSRKLKEAKRLQKDGSKSNHWLGKYILSKREA